MPGQSSVLRVSKSAAHDLFLNALDLARGDDDLPQEWIERTTRINAARNKTYTPVLGTVLLAKATNRNVSALALKIGGVHRGYSPRALAKEVFVPLCVANRIDIRTQGAEPFNNQPFFAKDIIHKDLVAPHSLDRPDLEYLVSCLEQADYLEGDGALAALAAYLRTRIAIGRRGAVLDLDIDVLGPAVLARVTAEMINTNREGGRRGQAFLAACLDLAHDGRTIGGAINDPSNRIPGDVAVTALPAPNPPNEPAPQPASALTAPAIEGMPAAPAMIILAAEAKQKPVAPTEILQFAQRLAASGIGKALYAALDPAQAPLDTTDLQSKAAEWHNIQLQVFTDPADLLHAAIHWSPLPIEECLTRFPQLLARRLEDFHCDPQSQQEWQALLHEAVQTADRPTVEAPETAATSPAPTALF